MKLERSDGSLLETTSTSMMLSVARVDQAWETVIGWIGVGIVGSTSAGKYGEGAPQR